MNTTHARGRVSKILALVLATAALVLPAGSASAEAYEHDFTATVDQVQVNRYGGITVSGSLDCSAQVADIYGGAELIPDNTSVFISKSWVATQYVGKGKVATASYDSGIASVCYTNDAGVYDGDVVAPWSWSTLYAYPTGETQWVYSQTGKFGSGSIHVELTVTGELTVGEGEGADTHYFYDASGWNLRTTRVR